MKAFVYLLITILGGLAPLSAQAAPQAMTATITWNDSAGNPHSYKISFVDINKDAGDGNVTEVDGVPVLIPFRWARAPNEPGVVTITILGVWQAILENLPKTPAANQTGDATINTNPLTTGTWARTS